MSKDKFTVITAIARLASISQALQIMSIGELRNTPQGYKLWSDDLADIADLFADKFDAVMTAVRRASDAKDED